MSNLQFDDNESWLLEQGDRVLQRKQESGLNGLSDKDKILYCLWAIDYAVRNAAWSLIVTKR